jgi:hypothetical protein
MNNVYIWILLYFINGLILTSGWVFFDKSINSSHRYILFFMVFLYPILGPFKIINFLLYKMINNIKDR